MNKIHSVMLALLRSAITGEPVADSVSASVTPETLPELYSLSKSQDLTHLVAYALFQNGILSEDSEAGKKFFRQQMLAIVRFERINYELDSICRVFEEAQIPFAPLKGAVMRKYYPEPWMRTSCDIDILIKPEDLERSAHILSERLNYRIERKNHHDLSTFSESGIHVEIHYTLVEQKFNGGEFLSNIWEYLKLSGNSRYRYEMPADVFYIYHLAHIARHFHFGGCGVRPFIDLWIMLHNGEFSVKDYDSLLEKTNLKAFNAAAVKLAEVWFDSAEPDSMSEQFGDYILKAGIYGNMENKVAVNQIKKGGKFRYAISRIFMPYDDLILLYPSLNGKKFLLPFYEIRRWFKIVFIDGRKRSLRELGINQSLSDNYKEQTKSMFQQLGLLQ